MEVNISRTNISLSSDNAYNEILPLLSHQCYYQNRFTQTYLVHMLRQTSGKRHLVSCVSFQEHSNRKIMEFEYSIQKFKEPQLDFE
jgi:hypothetical protein